jgi:hypothetical protein
MTRAGIRGQGLGFRDEDGNTNVNDGNGARASVSPLTPNPQSPTPARGAAAASPTPNPQPLTPAHSARRGVLLLVVLSLLVLFTLIGVTFVLVASQSRRSTRADSRGEQYGDDPQKQLDSVFSQIVRDTTNPHSVLRGHSLLNDIYGNDGLKMSNNASTIAIAQFAPNSPFQTVTFTPAVNSITSTTAPYLPIGNVPQPNCPLTTYQVQTPGYFNGCVLTLLDGPGINQSARIVGWSYNSGPGTYTATVLAFDKIMLATLNSAPTYGMVINGRPFNGTGHGFDATAGTISASGSFPTSGVPANVPFALLPNPVFFPTTPAMPGYNVSYAISSAIGGADEDYDAQDPQNMFLAYMPIGPTVSKDILPSFHRPELLQYVTSTYSTVTDQNALKRLASFRPQNADHPNFPVIDEINGPWDIDNDGDGIPDSIWIDAGFPVQTGPDGRRFKPLAAILAVDLDGRLNVNAHGNIAQANTFYATPILNPPANTIADSLFAPTPPSTVSLPRGSGYGPPEINLSPLFAPPFGGSTNYSQFFTGNVYMGRNYEGRYGEYGTTPIAPSPLYPFPMPGKTQTTGPDNVLDLIKRFDFPNTGNYYGSPPSSYGTPSDLWGRSIVGIDYAGQPIYSFLQQTPVVNGSVAAAGTVDPDMPNDPYTINLSRRRVRGAQSQPTTNDNAFTVEELEAVLRGFDLDGQNLPTRLSVLTNAISNQVVRGAITTDSYDLPSPSILPTKDIASVMAGQYAGQYQSSLHIVDLLRAKLMNGIGVTWATITPAQQTTINNQIALMLPPEVIAGQRFDLNRPFGNGQDDDLNNVVDEPTQSEFSAKQEVPATWASAYSAAPPTGFDLNNDGSVISNPANPASDLYARQQYARYLYVLMMLFADQNYPWAQDSAMTAAMQQELTARRIAQWAVNVVDFRDPDSIMTPFEYDVNPFNADGWSVDGVLGTFDDNDVAGHPDRRLAWGAEQPELLLTETLAFHDRRVKDTATGNKINDPPMTADTNMDQVRIPQGSLYLELYCSHTGNASAANSFSGDIHSFPQRKLNLSASPDGIFPVWRVAISQSKLDAAVGPAQDVMSRLSPLQHPDLSTFDPITTGYNGPFHSSLFDPANPQGALLLERLVWCSSINPAGNPEAPFYSIYYNKANPVPQLLGPGQYAVIGPRNLTYVGMNAATPTQPSAQKFELDTATGTVKYTNANANPPNNAVTNVGALPIICVGTAGGADIGVSISEPLLNTYYPLPTVAGPTGVVDTYVPINNTPLDSGATTPLGKDNLQGTKLTSFYKTALLQRIANPLLPYNAATNPYITVDWQPIDLFVFNGEERPPVPKPDPADPAPSYNPAGGRERGLVPSEANLWTLLPQLGTTTVVAGGASDVFDYNLNQSLGYLNKALGTPWISPPLSQAAYAGAPNPTTGNKTFPWITWNNRPFVSNMELLQVPATSAEQLLRQFTYSPMLGTNPYDATAPPGPTSNFHVPFKHLANFFLSGNGTPGTASYLYRLLEYVHVPSRFVDTETYLAPASAPLGFLPPFNKVSSYRDPGRVNINTIPGPPGPAAPLVNPIWTGILNPGAMPTAPGPTWQQIIASRRGDPLAGANVLTPKLTPASTVFGNPFRTAGGYALALPGATSAPLPAEVDVTLMRPDPIAPGSNLPLFQLPAAAAQSFTNPDRNAYFRYQPLERLSNLLTTRSNVYAVWITVGYFEVTTNPGGVDVAHPDGYQLGQEIGSESGEVTRHRAFYIYDRSIPVGFEPGKDHNIDQGVLIKRFIE